MIAKDWILKLKEEGILIEGVKNGKTYLHLQTPCEIQLTANATKLLNDNYEAKRENGGVLVAIPKRFNGITFLTIDRVIFLSNVASTPQNSYLPDERELKQALMNTYSGEKENSLPIRFHTHPTHSDNPINETLNYIYQCNTSGQDQLVSDYPVTIGSFNILMPRSLILCGGKLTGKMFIGFYNGLIAPIEFETHRHEQTEKAVEKIFNTVSDWVEEDNNKWWLIGGGIVLAFLIIRYNKFAIPLIFMLVLIARSFVNDQHGKSQYFAQVTTGNVTIEIP